MKKMLSALLVCFLCRAFAGVEQHPPQSAINGLMNEYYAAQKVTPLPAISDQTFVRRAYLDIAGRIPTYEECTTFLGSKDPYKRDKLVDDLLDSPAFNSHMFNWWADLLRLKSRLSNQIPGGQEYIDWIKQCIEDNVPFDQVVYALITAEGYPHENPATGYYMRDTGMPLDNMSNTAQIFLGTQLQCAQCHDHPFDDWTQKQFYELAAHTYGVQTRIRPQNQEAFQGVMEHARRERMQASRDGDRAMFRAFQEIFAPFAFGAKESIRPLRLPKDYQYDNGKPNETVEPRVIFGEAAATSKGVPARESYANWIISPENPRFTKVIANRMWKKVMGLGLFEPVDDFTSEREITHPKLLDYLSTLMTDVDYDLKEFLRTLYKTDLYQREKNTKDIRHDETWHFTGPIMHRMTAEQIWDSMMTLAIKDLDTKSGPRVTQRYGDLEARAKNLKGKSSEEIFTMAKDLADLEKGLITKQASLRQRAQDMGNDPAERRRLAREQNQYQRERRIKTNEILGIDQGGGEMMGASMMSPNPRNRMEQQFVRASELPSPAQNGHFLRQFGQSDREVIENANTEASVPQVLAMMNGQFSQNLLHERSMLRRTVSEGDGLTEMIDRLFLTVLSRKPDASERQIIAQQFKKRGKMAMQDITWALVNTQQFVFIP